VRVAKVTVRDLPVTLRAPVELRPLIVADVGSKTLGVLDAVLIERGDLVKRGQLLALVRPSDLPDQLAATRSALAQNLASAQLARLNFDRARTLAPAAVVSQQELQQAQANLAAAEAAQAVTQAQIAALGVRLGETRILAPMNGVVATRRVDPGSLVGPSSGPILTIMRTDVLRVFLAVPEREAPRLAVGKEAFVEVDALPGRRLGGKVVRVAPALDPGTRTLEAEVQLPNPTGELRPGMYGRASLILDTHRAARVVPASAVVVGADRAYAFVHSQGVVKRRAVKLGFDAADELEILEGLAPGDEVIVAGQSLVSDGMKIRVAREGGAPSGS
jgi:RND family efflux transporter MFP subunit